MLQLCSDCAFHMPGLFAGLCEASTADFDCKEEEYGAWQENNLGE